VKIMVAKHFAEGGKGALEVAKEVVRLCELP
jgi:formyltetrahydrofolate synthetase